MSMDTTDLFLLYFGGGFALSLAWAALQGEALIGTGHRGARMGVAALAAVALVHPVAGVAAVDLVRLNRSVDDAAPLYPPLWTVLTIAAATIGALTTMALVASAGST